ncbi:MAG: hypothetical protein IK122_02115 [Alphaproteobacteria bacterium]|nr:hypothetical protein [Alphaproteobacteria bacterium]
MKFNEKDKNSGCVLVIVAIVMAALVGCMLEKCQNIIKDVAKSEQASKTVKPTKKNIIVPQIFWNNKNIRTR